MIPEINHGKPYNSNIDISYFEKKYNAKYVCELSIMAKRGWAASPAQIYYQEEPPQEGYSNYFAIVQQEGQVFITTGASVVGIPIHGVMLKSGEVIYSRYGHDYRSASTGDVSVDGGLEYMRILGDPSTYDRVTLTIKGPELVLVSDPSEIECLESNLATLKRKDN
jgi:hypothetical protein